MGQFRINGLVIRLPRTLRRLTKLCIYTDRTFHHAFALKAGCELVAPFTRVIMQANKPIVSRIASTQMRSNLIHVKKCPGKSKPKILDCNIRFSACVWVIIYKVNN